MNKEFIRYENTKKKNESNCKNKGGIRMATQIAATPVLYGKEALNVLMEAKTKPSTKSKENEKKLLKVFKLVK